VPRKLFIRTQFGWRQWEFRWTPPQRAREAASAKIAACSSQASPRPSYERRRADQDPAASPQADPFVPAPLAVGCGINYFGRRIMSDEITRRESFRRGLAAAGVYALLPEWQIPGLAQGETDVPFTDIPKTFNPNNPNTPAKIYDIRKIDGMLTPPDQFFTTQHFAKPEIDANQYRVKFTGMVKNPTEFSLAELKAMKSNEVVFGFECSGNSPRLVEGFASCGRFRGVRLSAVLKQVGVHPQAREVVFFGTDRGMQDVVFRQQTFKLEQQFGRSITLENAMKPEPLLAYEMDGQPLTRNQGFPVRLIMPGWYGVANVKWLAEVHLQEERYLGNFQARWYRTLRGVGGTGEDNDPQTQWVENEVTRMRLKSVIARVRKTGNAYEIFGFVLNDGTPVKSVEVQIDNGSWQKATLDRSNTQYSWKLFSYRWEGATPGEHTLVSRASDMNGTEQPTAADLKRKKTFLEDNAQFPRKVMIA
jgi:DMSO/TMAO reductase YedYZ molybdopterin-dependent catalytic subunit